MKRLLVAMAAAGAFGCASASVPAFDTNACAADPLKSLPPKCCTPSVMASDADCSAVNEPEGRAVAGSLARGASYATGAGNAIEGARVLVSQSTVATKTPPPALSPILAAGLAADAGELTPTGKPSAKPGTALPKLADGVESKAGGAKGGGMKLGGSGAGAAADLSTTPLTDSGADREHMANQEAGSYTSGAGGAKGAGAQGGDGSGRAGGNGGVSASGAATAAFGARAGGPDGDTAGETTAKVDDPEDYFTRTGLDDDLFKKVEKRYRAKSLAWK